MRHNSLLIYLVLATGALLALPSYAHHQVNIRTGLTSGEVGGAPAAADSFLVVPALDFDYEVFSDLQTSHVFRMTIATDMSTAQTKYFGASYGRKYYFGGHGKPVFARDSGGSFSQSTRLKYFAHWRGGFALIMGRPATASLTISSTGLDIGGGGGVGYNLSPNWGLHTMMDVGYVYGFSSVALTAINIQFLFGLNFAF